MKGFFTKAQTKSTTRPDGRHLSCHSCGLYKNSHTPKMQPYGNFEKQIMVIGEYPSDTDDVRGKPFQGASGSLLREVLDSIGINLYKDCISFNAVNCRPIDKSFKFKKPEPFQLCCCQRSVFTYIEQYKPKVIILMGQLALASVVGNRWKKELGTINKWAGWCIPDQELLTWICPTFSQTQVYNNGKIKQEILNVWKSNLKKAVGMCKKSIPVYKEPKIEYLESLESLNSITSGIIAFDYETTGLKPHAIGHQIVCASVAVSENEAKVFLMPNKRKMQRPFINLLTNREIKKIAQNLKFEHTWSYNCLGVEVVNWFHDTQLCSHVLDNREGITGLKFQTYVQFGVIDYSSEISPYLQADGSNAFNKLIDFVKDKTNAKKVMKYCALDSVFTYRLAMLQMQQINEMIVKDMFKV